MVIMADAIAEEEGQNVPYCASMDFSYLPQILKAIMSDDELHENDLEKPVDSDLLDDLRFLARNNRALPEELSESSLEDIRTYIRKHLEDILSDIRSICEEDYEDSLGRPFCMKN